MAGPPRPPPVKPSKKPGPLREAAADGIVTAAFIFFSASFGELAAMLAEISKLDALACNLGVLIAGLLLFDPFRVWVGGDGASFNPSNNMAAVAAGKAPLFSNVFRVGAQALGAGLGAFAALHLYPSSWSQKFVRLGLGLRPDVTLIEGILCEFLLGFLLNGCILYAGSLGKSESVLLRGLAMALPLVATGGLIMGGAAYTGPSMNPAFTFAWFWHTSGHDSWEHFLVFWLAPLAGGALVGLLWAWLASPAAPQPSKKSQQRSAQKTGPKAAPKKAPAGGKGAAASDKSQKTPKADKASKKRN